MSLVEAVTNVAVGFAIAVPTQLILFPRLGLQVSVTDNLVIAAIFTAVSIARSYALQRLFEAVRVDKARAAARGGDGSGKGERGQSAMR